MTLRLVRPTFELKEAALQYRQEHFDYGETIINGSELLDKTESYEVWLQSITDNTCPDTVNPNWVVTDTFFALDEKDKIVGIIAIEKFIFQILRYILKTLCRINSVFGGEQNLFINIRCYYLNSG